MPARAPRRWTVCGLIVAALALAAPGAAQAAPPSCDPLTLQDVHAGDTVEGTLVCAPGSLGFEIGDPPSAGFATVDAAGNVSYSSYFGSLGPDGFDVLVTEDGNLETATVPVTVVAVNERPLCEDMELEATTGLMAFRQPDCTDADPGDFLDYAIATQPANGTASSTFGGLQYTSDPGFTGTDTFTYTATDGIETSVPVPRP